MTEIGISLGWNCKPAIHLRNEGRRPTKAQGYKTCPFDFMISNYEGLIQCLSEDFAFLTDSKYLKIHEIHDSVCFQDGEQIIINTRYGFIFNHESPGHADLYLKQNWPGGINHYVDNDFAEFKKRYDQRAQNFRNYLNSGEKILFRFRGLHSDLTEIEQVLKMGWPKSNFESCFTIEDEPHLLIAMEETMKGLIE